MRIGVPKETAAGEHRVALVPEVVGKLKAKGLDVVVQSGAGEGALLADAAFADAGAELTADAAEVWRSDIVVTIAPPDPEQIRALGSGSILIGFLAPLTSPTTTRALAEAKATAFAMEAIPRISRAQSMDALSSQSNVAGYRSALLGAVEIGRFFPMLMTAAGTIPPAKVLVLGVGVAGLQALATARRLGARTTGYDVRPEVAEQVESLGAQWLDLGLEASGEGGYARELTDEERARQQQALTDAIKGFDVVITTALVPGRPAPRLVTAEAVEGMKAGSVIVDLAGESGGNCELTEPGETVIRHDVKIVSPLNLPAGMAEHSSQLFARNVLALLELFVAEDGTMNWTSRTRSSAAPAWCGRARSSTRGRVRRSRGRRRDPREHPHHEPRDPRARRLHRLRRDLEGAEHAAHAADVGHERDPRDRPARRPARDRAVRATTPSTRSSS